jgi:hypothetical protein
MAENAWVGPTARAFASDLNGHLRDLQSALKTAIRLAQQAVQNAEAKGA